MNDHIPNNHNNIEDIFSSASVEPQIKASSLSSGKSKQKHKDNFKDVYSTSKKSKDKSPKKKKTKGKKAWAIIWKSFVAVFLVGIITLSILTTSLTIYVMGVVDNPEDGIDITNTNLSFSSEVVYIDSNGEEQLLATYHSGQKVVWTNIEDMPDNLKNAFIYTEDETFYQHEGVNFKRTFAAFANLFFKFWESNQGGSTITQQLVKNITNDRESGGIEGIERKIREIFRAMNVERRFSKQQILEAYLNIVPLSNNVYGVGAAAKFYFNKTPAELTLAECAALAGMTRNPEKYRPDTKAEESKKRRAYTLKNMYDWGAISSEEYNTALSEEVDGTRNGYLLEQGKEGYDDGIRSDFVDNLFEELCLDFVNKYNVDKDEAADMIRSGGYKIYATIDPAIQSKLEEKYAPGQEKNFTNSGKAIKEGIQSAFVVMNYDGEVKGVIGRLCQEKTMPGALNRATQSKLRIGSTVKPISIYAPAIKNDLINYSTIINGAPEKGESNKASGDKWMPNNYENAKYGRIPVSKAVASSVNVVAVRVGRGVGVENMFSFMKNDLKFTALTNNDNNLSPMTLGSLYQGVYLDQLAASYAMFGNGGWHTQSHSYTKVVDASGEMVLECPAISAKTQVLDEASSMIMNRLLREVVENGTGKAASLGEIEVIGKTGTTSDNYDRLFVGMTPDYIGAVWYAYDYPSLIEEKKEEIQKRGEAEGWPEEEISRQKAAIQEQYSDKNVNRDLKNSGMKGSAEIWKNIMQDMPHSGKNKFDIDEEGRVIRKARFDPTTGKASSGGVWGYFKLTDTPGEDPKW